LNNPLWDKAVHEIVSKLPDEQVTWLMQKDNQKPLSSSQIVDLISNTYSTNSGKIMQRFFSKIDPILSHISSFQASIDVVVQNSLVITGTIWAVFHLLIQVSAGTKAGV